MIDAFLFDKDATLLDFERTWGEWCLTLIGELSGGDAQLRADLAAAIRFDLTRATFFPDSPAIAGTPEEGVDLILPLLPDWERDALLAFANKKARGVTVYELLPLAPVLDALRKTARLGIATNDAEASARRHMEAVGVADRFDLILGSDSGHGGKPAPGMCLAFAQQMDLAPERVAMVGDSLHDLHAGRAAGMFCIGVTSGFAHEAELAPHADLVVADISHLPGWLAQQ